MTVQELITKLQSFGPLYADMPVTIRGYEGGVNVVDNVRLSIIHVNGNKGMSYYGDHEEKDEDSIRCDMEWDLDSYGYDDLQHAVRLEKGY